jgi:hypothetical protein
MTFELHDPSLDIVLQWLKDTNHGRLGPATVLMLRDLDRLRLTWITARTVERI